MPWEFTRTVPPSFELGALLTNTLEVLLLDVDAGWLEAAALLELLELPPHALTSSETPATATRSFIDAYT